MPEHPYMAWQCKAGTISWELLFNSDSSEVMMVKPEKHLHYAQSAEALAEKLMYGLGDRDMLYIVPVYHTDREHPTHFVVEHPPRPERKLHTLADVYNGDNPDLARELRGAAQRSPGVSHGQSPG